MHVGEFAIDVSLVRALVADQRPDLAELPIHRVRSTGTVNAIFRIGDQLCARLPRLPHWEADLDNEVRLLPRLADRVSMAIPEPVWIGRPSERYPCRWALFRWLPGRPYPTDGSADERAAAVDLARFVRELRSIEVSEDVPQAGRQPLADLDHGTRSAIRSAAGAVDSDAAETVWDHAVALPPWSGEPVWIHTDLLPPNLLLANGRLSAVIDFGGAGAGDPAADVVPAWSVFGPSGRATYRAELDTDDDTWARARGYALHQAAVIIPYYRDTNPAFAAMAQRTVAQVIMDASES